jgi:hypothetical protein
MVPVFIRLYFLGVTHCGAPDGSQGGRSQAPAIQKPSKISFFKLNKLHSPVKSGVYSYESNSNYETLGRLYRLCLVFQESRLNV